MSSLIVVLAASLLSLVTGCQSSLPANDLDLRLSRSTGVAERIDFHVEGEPIDVPAAQDSARLTMSQAVRDALLHSPELQAALARTRAALADAKQARLLPNPILSLVVRFPEGGGKPQIDAGLSTELLSLLQAPRRTSAADHRLRKAAAEVLVVALDRVSEVQQQYAAVQAADAESAIVLERQRLNTRMLELARKRLEAGEGTRLDVLSLDADRVALEVEIAQANSDRRDARFILARLLGQPSGPAEWELSSLPEASIALDEAACIRAALEHRPEMQAIRWELAALGDEAALASWLDGSEVGAEAERDGDWSVGPAASTPLPLLDWGTQRRAKADALRIEARHRLTATGRQVVEDVRRALEVRHSSQAALDKVEKELIPLSDQRIAQAETAYTNGAADITTVLLAQQEAQAARLKRVELQQKSAASLYRLHRALGGMGVARSLEVQ